MGLRSSTAVTGYPGCLMSVDKSPYAPVRELLAMLPQNGGVDTHRLPVLAGLLARYSLLEPLRQVEARRYAGALASHELSAAPVFILGFWRSGTTRLQTLLREDPRFVSSTVFRSLFSDVFLTTEAWLKPVLQRISRMLDLPLSIQRRRMDFDQPAEGDVALCSGLSPHAYTWGHVFPRRFDAWLDRTVVHPTDAQAQALMDDYDHFLRKLSYQSGGKRLVIKTPGDTGRARLLLERYPDARFVYIHRDPIEVFHSNLYLWGVILREVSLQGLEPEELEGLVIRTYQVLVRAYLEDREQIPDEQRCEVRFEDLQRDPLATLAGVYTKLDLGPLPEAELSAFLASEAPYDQPRYVTSPELEDTLRAAWEFAFTAWPRPQPQPTESRT